MAVVQKRLVRIVVPVPSFPLVLIVPAPSWTQYVLKLSAATSIHLCIVHTPPTIHTMTRNAIPKGPANVVKSCKRTFKNVLGNIKVPITFRRKESQAGPSTAIYKNVAFNDSEETLVDVSASVDTSKVRSILKKAPKKRPNKHVRHTIRNGTCLSNLVTPSFYLVTRPLRRTEQTTTRKREHFAM